LSLDRTQLRAYAIGMKLCLFGVTGMALGKHNLKDPRLDQVHGLVEAQKKTYAQIDVVSDTRLERGAGDAEKAVLQKIAEALVSEKPVSASGLSPDELVAVAAHSFSSNRPVVVAREPELADPDPLLLRAFAEAGYINFLTVGGKENRAWPIRAGLTAWEAAGTIHTDIQKGFIRAEIISFADLLEAGGETQAKRAGKQRLELKTYVMQDYDIANFRFNK
jgi:ribosome-binding ATPase YchF (GTP1/OBG family)